jgi:hypothetical protein
LKGPPTDKNLERLLARKRDLGNLRSRVWHNQEENPEQAEELDRFLSKVLSIDEEIKDASKDALRPVKFERDEKVRSLRQARNDLCEMAFDDFNSRWMTRISATVDYWLEVALDLEGVLHGYSNPRLEAPGLTLTTFLTPGAAVISAAMLRGLGGLLFLAAVVVVLYFASGTGFWRIGWLLAAYLAWLIYCGAQRADKLERDSDRWVANLSVVLACVNEVQSGHFDASEIARRLRDQEKDGLFVHTTIFTVLGRSAALQQAKDTRDASAGESTKPTQEEKEHWAFERASTLTLSELRAMKPGEVLRLIERSWFYPSEKAAFDRFEYKHERVGEENSSEFGNEVHGFRRFSGAEDWEPYQFLASEKESQTSSCSGTIKRLE